MKIYILRHEDRTQDASFFSPLTINGLENSKKLITYLDKIDINIIISSPFIRTLQTIYPYAKHHDMKVKLEYSLSEIQDTELISKNSAGTRIPEYMAKLFLYDPNYKSALQPEEVKYPETEKDIDVRIKNFLKIIINNYGKTDNNILLVTHQAICNKILQLVYKHSTLKPTKELLINYPKGAVTLIFEELNWTFKPINYKL